MECLPLDILGKICCNLKLTDCISLSIINKSILTSFTYPTVVNSIAIYNNYPCNLTLLQLKGCESKTISERLSDAIIVNDKRIIEGLFKLCSDFIGPTKKAARLGDIILFNRMIEKLNDQINKEKQPTQNIMRTKIYIALVGIASCVGNLNIIDRVIELNSRNRLDYYSHAVFRAAEADQLEIFNVILERNFSNINHTKLAKVAAEFESIKVMNRIIELIETGIILDDSFGVTITLIKKAVTSEKVLPEDNDIIDKLIAMAPLNEKSSVIKNAIYDSPVTGSIKFLNKMTSLLNNIPSRDKDINYNRLLKCACEYGRTEYIERIIEFTTCNYEEPLAILLEKGYKNVLDVFLKLGDLNRLCNLSYMGKDVEENVKNAIRDRLKEIDFEDQNRLLTLKTAFLAEC